MTNNGDAGGRFGALMMGIGIGVVATVVLLAANERRFHDAVEGTKRTAKKLKNRFGHAMDEIRDSAGDAAESLEGGARNAARKLSG